jgi:hypothetical protein
MTEEELARTVSAELGGDALAQAEAELRQPGERSFLHHAVEVATVGSFVVQTVRLAIQLAPMYKSLPELKSKLLEKTSRVVGIGQELRRNIIERVVQLVR